MAFVPKSRSPHEEEAVETDHDAPNPRQLYGFPAAAAAPIAFRTRGSELRLRSSSDNMVEEEANAKIVEGDFGYVLEDVPHLVDYLPDVPTYPNPLQDNAAYSVVKQYFVNVDDTVPYKIVVQKNSPRGVHFRRAGPRQRVNCAAAFQLFKDHACPCYLYFLPVLLAKLIDIGAMGGYRGFYARNTIPLTPKTVNDIHKRGGTILGTSRGGHDTIKIVDNIEDRGINQVYIIGGDGTQKGALEIFKEIRRRRLKVAVAGIPKTIDNDIAVIDKSFGFDTAVEEAQRAINAAHVESESVENGIGLVKLMGRYSGFIAMYATLPAEMCEYNHNLIIRYPYFEMLSISAYRGLLLQKQKMVINLKYIDPTYMIRAIPSIASDNVYCTLLAHSAIHGAMAGYTGFTVGLVNGRHTYIPFHTYPNPLQDNAAYSVVKQYFVNVDDTVPYKIVVQKNSPRGVHFRRAGPRQRVYFKSDDVLACIVTCGGLCPGLNTVIRELVCGLSHMYNVKQILGIEGGYRGFYARNTIPLIPKTVNDIHKRGGTILGTSRGGHDTIKIVDNIEDRGINQVYIIGGDGTQKGALEIFKEIRRRGLKVAVAGIPKTIDNDIAVIDKSFGFDTAVEEAQRAINAAHVESESVENGIGLVKLMGRYSGFIAMYATLASRDVDCCLIPESPFYLEGPGGLFEYIEKRLKENGHMVIVVAEGAGQKLIAESMQSMDHKDASGNKLLLDVGLWLSHKIKAYFSRKQKMVINLKYIDPTYMIRAIPSIASDNVYCTLLAHSAIHGAMAGYTGFTVGLVNGRHTYIPFHRVTQTRNKVVITDRMWARLLSSTNQPSFLSAKDIEPKEPEKPLEGSTAKGNRDGETTLPNGEAC
ncbi:ATP-dependent 6-phosphofructokinase 3 [Ananas comosus]|uniref:ATP-dependent 6-phosphofructokinase n=1 Tax=Ananas comosus TaxID=4615 RepID=A0A199VZS6_ANACO|nr:ATP-dependent 6-phosphofructokinase 3 [Ananas comosus]